MELPDPVFPRIPEKLLDAGPRPRSSSIAVPAEVLHSAHVRRTAYTSTRLVILDEAARNLELVLMNGELTSHRWRVLGSVL